jgi:hypothetical protein
MSKKDKKGEDSKKNDKYVTSLCQLQRVNIEIYLQ